MDKSDSGSRHMKRADYVTTIPRAMVAMLVGAAIGALVFFVQIMALVVFEPFKMDDLASAAGTTNLELISVIAGYGLAYFAVGLLIVVPPVWWLLHRLGRRNWFDALGLGAVLSPLCFVLVALWDPNWQALSLISYATEDGGGITAVNDRLTADGWSALIRGAAGIAVSGALAGLTIWRIAYRKQPVGEHLA